MFGALGLVLLWIFVRFGRASAPFFSRAPVRDEDLDVEFSRRSLPKLMTNILELARNIFGDTVVSSLLRFNVNLYFLFVLALVWQIYWITGFDLLHKVVSANFSVDVGSDEREFVLKWIAESELSDNGRKLYVGRAYGQIALILVSIVVTVSAT